MLQIKNTVTKMKNALPVDWTWLRKECETKPDRIQGEIKKCTAVVKDFNTLLSVIDRCKRQKTARIELN